MRSGNRLEEFILEQDNDPPAPDIICVILGILTFSLIGVVLYIFFLFGQESVQCDSAPDCIITSPNENSDPAFPKFTSSTIPINHHHLSASSTIKPSTTGDERKQLESFLPRPTHKTPIKSGSSLEMVEGSGEAEKV